MDYKIRKIKESEYSVLGDFLYEAIFIPEGVKSPPREIIEQPELQVYISDFGKHKGDCCLVAELDKRIIGAVWVRIMNDYGHIDDETPSFAISLYPEYRNHGIGTALMKSMLKLLNRLRLLFRKPTTQLKCIRMSDLRSSEKIRKSTSWRIGFECQLLSGNEVWR